MEQLHDIQRAILKKLQFSPKLRYLELKPDSKIENNQFDFHLKRLLTLGYISKEGTLYDLTVQGKQFITGFDTHKGTEEKPALNAAWIICIRTQDNEREFLVYTRKKQPFFGCQGFLTGKVKQGETVVEAAIRELHEEANLDGTPSIKGVVHFISSSSKTKELVQDKFMYICVFENPTGELVSSFEGAYEWIKEKNFLTFLQKPFSRIEDELLAISLIDKTGTNIFFTEIRNEVNDY